MTKKKMTVKSGENRYLSSFLTRGRNNFDLVRLLAALGVMLGHAYSVTNPTKHADFVRKIFSPDYSGSLAVYAFFLISGILISQSFDRLRNPVHFVTMRVARLWPGLAVNVLITVFIIGPIFTDNPSIKQYFLNDSTIAYLRVNLLYVTNFVTNIDSIFSKNRLSTAINYPLWSLTVEAQCYAIVMFLGCFGIIRRRVSLLISAVALALAFIPIAKSETMWPFTVYFFHIFPKDYSLYPVVYFLAGVCCYAMREKIKFKWQFLLPLLAATIASHGTSAYPYVFMVAFGYSVLFFSTSKRILALNPKHDYSYGIYIYGFICQQAVASLLPGIDGYISLMIAIVAAVLLAAFSWHFVEAPALMFFRRHINSRPAVSASSANDSLIEPNAAHVLNMDARSVG